MVGFLNLRPASRGKFDLRGEVAARRPAHGGDAAGLGLEPQVAGDGLTPGQREAIERVNAALGFSLGL